jgi:hypothetical protein
MHLIIRQKLSMNSVRATGSHFQSGSTLISSSPIFSPLVATFGAKKLRSKPGLVILVPGLGSSPIGYEFARLAENIRKGSTPWVA